MGKKLSWKIAAKFGPEICWRNKNSFAIGIREFKQF